jgi:V/A-type H+-transporting ATPase subunit B
VSLVKSEYLLLDKVEGPLIVLSGVKGAAYDEIVEINSQGERKLGRVVQLDGDKVVIQVFETTTGLAVHDTGVSFTGKPLEISLSRNILGRMFNGIVNQKL